MAACHILQEEIYPSQVVNDNLDTSLAPTAATLEEDLNYIRSVLKRIHGGITWYDIGDQLANLPDDFQVEHYTTSENPVKAGQHKDIHAESVSAPYAVLDNYLQFANDSTPYRFVYETVGPFDESGGTRVRFSGANATGSTKSGINFEPSSTEFYSGIRARAYNYEFYTSSFDQYGGFSIISSALLGDVVSISSEFHQTNLRIGLSGGSVSLNARDGNNTVGSLEFSISPPRWSTKTLYLWSQVAPTLISETNALTIGPIGGSTGGLKFGNNEILGVKSSNQHAAIKLNSLGTEPVIVWDTVTAQNENPIVVGQEGYQVWHRGNQGHGSGLDADTVDGKHASDLLSFSGSIVNGADAYKFYKLIRIVFDTPLPQGVYVQKERILIEYQPKCIDSNNDIESTHTVQVDLYIKYQRDSGGIVTILNADVVVSGERTEIQPAALIAPSNIILQKIMTSAGYTGEEAILWLYGYVNSATIKRILFAGTINNKPLNMQASVELFDIDASTSPPDVQDTLDCTALSCIQARAERLATVLSFYDTNNNTTLQAPLGSIGRYPYQLWYTAGEARTLAYPLFRTSDTQYWLYDTVTDKFAGILRLQGHVSALAAADSILGYRLNGSPDFAITEVTSINTIQTTRRYSYSTYTGSDTGMYTYLSEVANLQQSIFGTKHGWGTTIGGSSSGVAQSYIITFGLGIYSNTIYYSHVETPAISYFRPVYAYKQFNNADYSDFYTTPDKVTFGLVVDDSPYTISFVDLSRNTNPNTYIELDSHHEYELTPPASSSSHVFSFIKRFSAWTPPTGAGYRAVGNDAIIIFSDRTNSKLAVQLYTDADSLTTSFDYTIHIDGIDAGLHPASLYERPELGVSIFVVPFMHYGVRFVLLIDLRRPYVYSILRIDTQGTGEIGGQILHGEQPVQGGGLITVMGGYGSLVFFSAPEALSAFRGLDTAAIVRNETTDAQFPLATASIYHDTNEVVSVNNTTISYNVVTDTASVSAPVGGTWPATYGTTRFIVHNI